ncbi:hypothetical protein ACJMK2_017889 [Sinanodonta woodiana]|uniref:Carboxylesterase type B domain-containing protein n=1 Tax=Sinanodonta woodiana TaxID=1069815 RepID=A0ABD3UBQ9_SINWO
MVSLRFRFVCAIFIASLGYLTPRVIIKQLGPSVISTKYGQLRGALVEFPNTASVQLKPVEAFSGVQYAAVRNNYLRFMPPTSPQERWQGVKSAWNHRAVCSQKVLREKNLATTMQSTSLIQLQRISQFTKTQNEDCLTLNLFVPLRGKFVLKLYMFLIRNVQSVNTLEYHFS